MKSLSNLIHYFRRDVLAQELLRDSAITINSTFGDSQDNPTELRLNDIDDIMSDIFKKREPRIIFILISPELVTDYQNLYVFTHRLAYPLETATAFDEVGSLPPSTRIVINDDALSGKSNDGEKVYESMFVVIDPETLKLITPLYLLRSTRLKL